MPFNGDALRNKRAEKGMSVPDIVFAFAQRGWRITSQAVYEWEQGKRPSQMNQQRIAQILGVDEGFFYTN